MEKFRMKRLRGSRDGDYYERCNRRNFNLKRGGNNARTTVGFPNGCMLRCFSVILHLYVYSLLQYVSTTTNAFFLHLSNSSSRFTSNQEERGRSFIQAYRIRLRTRGAGCPLAV